MRINAYTAHMNDAARALFHFFPDTLPWPEGEGAFYGAVDHPALAAMKGRLKLYQSFKPYAATLAEQGFDVSPEASPENAHLDFAFCLLPKSNIAARRDLAAALQALKLGGRLYASAALDVGGKRISTILNEFGLMNVQQFSKFHARVVNTIKPEVVNEAALHDAIVKGGLQPVLEGRYVSRPGIFGWDKADIGSQLLLQNLPQQLTGRGADFGCGYGFLAQHIVKTYNGITGLDCIDADFYALAAAKINLKDSATKVEYLWADLTKPLVDKAYDWIIMNPPFHEGKATEAEIGGAFIATAAKALKPGGRLFMVANVHLPYEDVLTQHFSEMHKKAQQNGFKVFEAQL